MDEAAWFYRAKRLIAAVEQLLSELEAHRANVLGRGSLPIPAAAPRPDTTALPVVVETV